MNAAYVYKYLVEFWPAAQGAMSITTVAAQEIADYWTRKGLDETSLKATVARYRAESKHMPFPPTLRNLWPYAPREGPSAASERPTAEQQAEWAAGLARMARGWLNRQKAVRND